MEERNSPRVEHVVTDDVYLNRLSISEGNWGNIAPRTLAKFSLFLVRTKGFVPFFL